MQNMASSCWGAQRITDKSKLNYQKLIEICQRAKNESDPLTHEQFMKEYHELFLPPLSTNARPKSWSAEQCRKTIRLAKLQPERPRTVTSSGLSKQTVVKTTALKSRLDNISEIVTKRPPFRTKDDIKRLASLLLYFPEFVPAGIDALVREEIASRMVSEMVYDRKGIALPREGGKYLIVQGRVQEIVNDIKQGYYNTRMLYAGEVFGEMKEMSYPAKHSYPIYIGEKRTLLLRLTVSDFTRAKEIVEERVLHDHTNFINSSSLLKNLPLHIRQKLAKQLQWKEIPAKTKILEEGEAVPHINIIKEGHCKVFKTTSNAFSDIKVCIGDMREGDCIGELVFEGCEIAPYTVVALTRLCVGQIPINESLVLELEKLHSLSRQYAVPLPSEETLQKLYAEKQIQNQWKNLKKSIVGQVYSRRLL